MPKKDTYCIPISEINEHDKNSNAYKGISVTAEEIISVEAASNDNRIYFTKGKKLVVAKVLQWFEALLPSERFVRIHRSHPVNKQFVKEVKGGRKRPS